MVVVPVADSVVSEGVLEEDSAAALVVVVGVDLVAVDSAVAVREADGDA